MKPLFFFVFFTSQKLVVHNKYTHTHRYRAPLRAFVTFDICTRNRWPSPMSSVSLSQTVTHTHTHTGSVRGIETVRA